MTNETEELQELKKLMQDLFIDDLIQEAAKVRDGIAVDWGAALNRFKHKFDETYLENYSAVNKPDIEDLITKIAIVSGENKDTQNRLEDFKAKNEHLVQTLIVKTSNINESLNKSFENLNQKMDAVLSAHKIFQELIEKTLTLNQEDTTKIITEVNSSREIETVINQHYALIKSVDKKNRIVIYMLGLAITLMLILIGVKLL